MKKLLILTVVLILLLILAPATMASTYYNLDHSIEVQFSGEFNFQSTVTTPTQGDVDIVLEGVGDARLKSDLAIADITKVPITWWDLF